VFGLFPANWGSFVEWFHRLVAMLTGFLILGTTVAAWRRGADRRVRYALALATILLPSQIALGALTVTEYELVILTAHFVTAASIYALVVAAAAWAYGADLRRLRLAVAAATLVLPAVALLSPRVFVTYSATVQAIYYALGLGAFGALVAATLWADDLGARRVRPVAGIATVALLALLVAGRLAYAADLLNLAGALVVLATTGLAAYLLYVRPDPALTGRSAAPGQSSD
jgi:cytochrome c oxidase assembly protein subunit 15